MALRRETDSDISIRNRRIDLLNILINVTLAVQYVIYITRLKYQLYVILEEDLEAISEKKSYTFEPEKGFKDQENLKRGFGNYTNTVSQCISSQIKRFEVLYLNAKARAIRSLVKTQSFNEYYIAL